MKLVTSTLFTAIITAQALLLLLLLLSSSSFSKASANDSSDAEVVARIVGGVVVEPKDRYPYMVHYGGCGGSLVHKDWVLSAAHCAGFGFGHVEIGRHDLKDDDEYYERIDVAEEITHPDYDRNTLDNDFMMLRLSRSSSYDVVELDDGSANTNHGADVTVMGWGTTSSGGAASPVLLEVEVDVVDNSECNGQYGGDGGAITDNMVCASRAGKDSCQGDSGGPLIVRGADASADVQVGVVSWGRGCAFEGHPGVYARVAAQIDWIDSFLPKRTPDPSPAPSSFDYYYDDYYYDYDYDYEEETSAPTSSPVSDGTKAPSASDDPLSWDIDLIEATDGTNGEGKPNIKVRYESSDRDYRVEVFEDDCETITDVFSERDDFTDSDRDGFVFVDVDLTVDQDEIENSPLWNADGSGFSFCMSMSLLTPGSSDPTVVTKKYTVFRVSVDNQVSFDINGIATEVEEVEEENIDMTYKGTVKAFQCDENTYEKVVDGTDEDDDGTVLGPFDTLNVCVEVDVAEEPGVVVDGITDLRITQEETGVSFVALDDGETDEDWRDLVDTKCNTAGVCMVRVQLIDAFFSTPKPINVGGVAILGGSGRRRNEDSGFELQVDLTQPCPGGEGKSFLRKIMKGQS